MTKLFIKESFNNLENIKKVTSPVLFIHGLKDRTINYRHSLELASNFIENIIVINLVFCKGETELIFPKNMEHNSIDFMNEMLIPIKQFFLK